MNIVKWPKVRYTSLRQGFSNPRAQGLVGEEFQYQKGLLSHFRSTLLLNVSIRTWSPMYVLVRIRDSG